MKLFVPAARSEIIDVVTSPAFEGTEAEATRIADVVVGWFDRTPDDIINALENRSAVDGEPYFKDLCRSIAAVSSMGTSDFTLAAWGLSDLASRLLALSKRRIARPISSP